MAWETLMGLPRLREVMDRTFTMFLVVVEKSVVSVGI